MGPVKLLFIFFSLQLFFHFVFMELCYLCSKSSNTHFSLSFLESVIESSPQTFLKNIIIIFIIRNPHYKATLLEFIMLKKIENLNVKLLRIVLVIFLLQKFMLENV